MRVVFIIFACIILHNTVNGQSGIIKGHISDATNNEDIPFANIYIKIFTKDKEYYENLYSLKQLEKIVSKFTVYDYTLKVIEEPSKFKATEILSEGTFFHKVIKLISNKIYFLIPTYIWILKKEV